METGSKFKLNPLATCFIPSSMKHQSTTCAVFPVPRYETSVNEHIGVKNGQLPIIVNKQNTEYFPVLKIQSNHLEKRILEDPFITTTEMKKTQSQTVEEEEVVEEPLMKTKRVILTVNEISGKETPTRSNDEGTSEPILKSSKGKQKIRSKDTGLPKLDLSLPNRTIIRKVSELLKGGTKTLWMLLPFAVRSLLVIEFFYRMGLRTISLNVSMTSPSCSVLKPNFNAITYPKKTKKNKIANIKAKSKECHCPPMFGWIVPFKFFGNPFQLSETCGKEYVHTSYVDRSSKQPQSEHSDAFECNDNDKGTVLEQCSLELKAVIKDVCDSLSLHEDSDLIAKSGKRPVWQTETVKEIRNDSVLDIIDDGNHPLLQEISEVESEDTEMPIIEAFLEKAFSIPRNTSEQEILPSQSICNLPCSVWCNKVPPPAKDAYKRFIRKMDLESMARHKVTDVKQKVLKKSLYKRCFSADDGHNYDKIPFLSTSNFESRERLLLLHKDPVSFIKQSSTSALRDISQTLRSKNSVVSKQVAIKDNSECGSNKWYLYDGADSMWQPLPECIPSSDTALKQSHRKARDMRRQKSVC